MLAARDLAAGDGDGRHGSRARRLRVEASGDPCHSAVCVRGEHVRGSTRANTALVLHEASANWRWQETPGVDGRAVRRGHRRIRLRGGSAALCEDDLRWRDHPWRRIASTPSGGDYTVLSVTPEPLRRWSRRTRARHPSRSMPSIHVGARARPRDQLIRRPSGDHCASFSPSGSQERVTRAEGRDLSLSVGDQASALRMSTRPC